MKDKPLVAHQLMKEFDPECEKHYPIMIIKAIDPGCTLEIQIECADGRVIRDTTTNDPHGDRIRFRGIVVEQFDRMWEWAESNADKLGS